MATKELKRMNRFELLEMMYELVRENEKLRRKCDRLEGRSGMSEEESTDYTYSSARRYEPEPDDRKPKRENTSGFSLFRKRQKEPEQEEEYWTDDDEHYQTRREEVMQRMMEQSYAPPMQKPARQATPARTGETWRPTPAAQPRAQPARAASQQPVRSAAPQQSARTGAQTQLQPRAAAKPVTREQPAVRQMAPAKPQVQSRAMAEDDFDVDSILQEYLTDMKYNRGG